MKVDAHARTMPNGDAVGQSEEEYAGAGRAPRLLTRRAVLASGGQLAGAVVLGRALPRVASGASAVTGPERTAGRWGVPTLAAFAPLVGSTFLLRSADGTAVRVVLKTAEALPPQEVLHGDAFTALFDGPCSPLINQSVMTISHESVGPFRLFVVPVDFSRSHQTYQVVVDPRVPV
jgi:hypothetical protein